MYSSQTYTALKKHFANPKLGGSACFLENYYVIFRKGDFFFSLMESELEVNTKILHSLLRKYSWVYYFLFIHFAPWDPMCKYMIYDIVSPSLRWTFEVAWVHMQRCKERINKRTKRIYATLIKVVIFRYTGGKARKGILIKNNFKCNVLFIR